MTDLICLHSLYSEYPVCDRSRRMQRRCLKMAVSWSMSHSHGKWTTPMRNGENVFLQLCRVLKMLILRRSKMTTSTRSETTLFLVQAFFHVKKVPAKNKSKEPRLARELPDIMYCTFNSDGMHFLSDSLGKRHEILLSFGYADIYRWGGSHTRFSLIIWDAEVQGHFRVVFVHQPSTRHGCSDS